MRNKYNLGHQYTDRYITEPYYSIDFMDIDMDLYHEFKKVKTVFLEADLDLNSKNLETDLRKFYEGVSRWISHISRDKIMFLLDSDVYELLLYQFTNKQYSELLFVTFDGNKTLSFRGILIGRAIKKNETFKQLESDPDLIEWDREFAEYLDRLKDENTTKRDK